MMKLPQIRLRTLLLTLTALCVFFAYVLPPIRQAALEQERRKLNPHSYQSLKTLPTQNPKHGP